MVASRAASWLRILDIGSVICFMVLYFFHVDGKCLFMWIANALYSIVLIRDYRKIVMLVDFVLQNVNGQWMPPVFFFVFLLIISDGCWVNLSPIMDSSDG